MSDWMLILLMICLPLAVSGATEGFRLMGAKDAAKGQEETP